MRDFDAEFKHFKKADPVLHSAGLKVRTKLTRKAAVRNADKLFATLAESVVSQQLSVKAADTIWTRLEVACGGKVTPASIKKVSLPRMRKAGLSGAKAKTLKELAKAVDKGLHLPALNKKSPEEATDILTEVWGIGPWTAEMFLMFGMNHPDIFSARDLGLVRAMEQLYGLKNPTHAKLEKIAAAWSPHRTLASRILWRTRDEK